MKSHARVVVIGGGIAGCSTLYHLTEEGLNDVILLERDELTSGSTWHAAAQVTQFGANQTMVALKRHSIDLYKRLSEDKDFPINYHITGGMRLAYNQDQLDTYRHYIGMAKGMGIDFELIDASEVKKRHPLMEAHDILGAWWDPLDGDIDPAQLTFALSRAARQNGATVSRFNPVLDISIKSNGEFIVHSEKGDITCEKLVNASGYRANEVGQMLGVEHPVVSMEHMYFLTEPIPQLQELGYRVPIIRDPGDDFYSRQEKMGLLVGVYEQGCKTFGMQGIDPHFTKSLCPSDLDRCLDNMEGIFNRLPCLTQTGIHTVINGPITYTPDGAPLIGAIPGVKNAYACLGLRAGIGEGGGHGKILAQIIAHGQSEWDAWFLDPRRFSSHNNIQHTALKSIEDYQNEFHYHLPHEYRPAARQAKTTPLYTTLDQMGCIWGVVAGWERVLCFKPEPEFEDTPGYRFSPTQDVVAKEIEHLTNHVSLMEVSGFARYSLTGEAVGEFLQSITCKEINLPVGKINLCYLLNDNGNLLCEATIGRLSENEYWYGCAAAAQIHDKDWLLQHKPDSVSLNDLTDRYTTLVVAGPKSRDLLQLLSPHVDLSNASLPWMHCKTLCLGHAKVVLMRVSFSGELAFEIHVANEQLHMLWQLLVETGKSIDLGYFGLYAAQSMRLEKGYLHWKEDIIDERTPFECGLDRFVNLRKDHFIGKDSLEQKVQSGNVQSLVALNVDCEHAPAHNGDGVYYNDMHIGSVTSAGYGHRVRKNIAFAFVNPQFSHVNEDIYIQILGEKYSAQIVPMCQYDKDNKKMRS